MAVIKTVLVLYVELLELENVVFFSHYFQRKEGLGARSHEHLVQSEVLPGSEVSWPYISI